MLSKPTLARCDNRSILAKAHPTAGEPNDWLNPNILKLFALKSLSFDFFVNWNQNSIGNEIWIKRIVKEIQHWPIDNLDTLMKWIEKVDSKEQVDLLTQFCKINKVKCHYFLFKEATFWSKDAEEIVDVEITSGIPATSLWNITGVRKRIRTLRGGAVPLGPGGLTWGTSTLECFLSHTPEFWPGDVDCLLLDKDTTVKGIIEYKKHTQDDPIEEQTLLRYRDRDKLKYQSLGLLRDFFSIKTNLPILMVYYPTKLHIKKVKIEKIIGNYDQLTVSKNATFPLPSLSTPESYPKFAKSLLDML